MDIKTMVKLYKELIVEKIQKSEKKVFWQICDKFTEIAKKMQNEMSCMMLSFYYFMKWLNI